MKILKVRMPRKKLHNRLEELENSRQDQYGSFEENMNKIAASWSIILDKHLVLKIEGWQVPLLYAQAKLIRATHKFKEDSYDDALAFNGLGSGASCYFVVCVSMHVFWVPLLLCWWPLFLRR